MNEKMNPNFIDPELEARLVAWVLGELSDFEAAQLETQLEKSSELTMLKLQVEKVHELLSDIGNGSIEEEEDFANPEMHWQLPSEKRRQLLSVLDGEQQNPASKQTIASVSPKRTWRRWLLSKQGAVISIAAALCLMTGLSWLTLPFTAREASIALLGERAADTKTLDSKLRSMTAASASRAPGANSDDFSLAELPDSQDAWEDATESLNDPNNALAMLEQTLGAPPQAPPFGDVDSGDLLGLERSSNVPVYGGFDPQSSRGSSIQESQIAAIQDKVATVPDVVRNGALPPAPQVPQVADDLAALAGISGQAGYGGFGGGGGFGGETASTDDPFGEAARPYFETGPDSDFESEFSLPPKANSAMSALSAGLETLEKREGTVAELRLPQSDAGQAVLEVEKSLQRAYKSKSLPDSPQIADLDSNGLDAVWAVPQRPAITLPAGSLQSDASGDARVQMGTPSIVIDEEEEALALRASESAFSGVAAGKGLALREDQENTDGFAWSVPRSVPLSQQGQDPSSIENFASGQALLSKNPVVKNESLGLKVAQAQDGLAAGGSGGTQWSEPQSLTRGEVAQQGGDSGLTTRNAPNEEMAKSSQSLSFKMTLPNSPATEARGLNRESEGTPRASVRAEFGVQPNQPAAGTFSNRPSSGQQATGGGQAGRQAGAVWGAFQDETESDAKLSEGKKSQIDRRYDVADFHNMYSAPGVSLSKENKQLVPPTPSFAPPAITGLALGQQAAEGRAADQFRQDVSRPSGSQGVDSSSQVSNGNIPDAFYDNSTPNSVRYREEYLDGHNRLGDQESMKSKGWRYEARDSLQNLSELSRVEFYLEAPPNSPVPHSNSSGASRSLSEREADKRLGEADKRAAKQSDQPVGPSGGSGSRAQSSQVDRPLKAAKRKAELGRKQITESLREGIQEKSAKEEAFSTFSLHVSDVSFKLAAAALAQGKWPDASKIRIEEFVNAFDYRDPLPSADEQVSCRLEQAIHPFLQQRNVLRVAMRTAATGRASATPLRLTLLLDNSGSMERSDRRETGFRALQLLLKQLRPGDLLTLISFANTPSLLVDKAGIEQAGSVLQRVRDLPSQGGTNIEAALELAFEKSKEQWDASAQNRVVLLTDGAVNLGDAEPESLSRIVLKMRNEGVAFDAAGISARDLNDEVLETLTRQGDGRYYLLDSLDAAEDGFAKQLAGALRPSAKNVKVQVEFNPQRVGAYKLLGFEKHRLKTEDFRNDKVDAAELAAAEAGVALYQFEPLADGVGDVGSVSVRFRDLATGAMVEKRWPIPYEPSALRLPQSGASLRVATSAAMFAAKLRNEPLGETVSLKTLTSLVASLPEQDRVTKRVSQLQAMLQQATAIMGMDAE